MCQTYIIYIRGYFIVPLRHYMLVQHSCGGWALVGDDVEKETWFSEDVGKKGYLYVDAYEDYPFEQLIALLGRVSHVERAVVSSLDSWCDVIPVQMRGCNVFRAPEDRLNISFLHPNFTPRHECRFPRRSITTAYHQLQLLIFTL